MDLSLNERQQLLRDAAAAFIKSEASREVIAEMDSANESFNAGHWKKAAGLGFLGMAVPSPYGGEGATLMDTAVVFEELGRAPLPGPYFSSGVFAAQLILEGGSEEQKRTVLPEVCRGARIVVPAITDWPVRWGPEAVEVTARPKNGSLVLEGSKPYVMDAAVADQLLCAVRTGAASSNRAEGISLVLVDKGTPGVSIRPLAGLWTGVAEVKFESAEISAERLVGSENRGWNVVDQSALRVLPVLTAYMAGGIERLGSMALSYSQTRVVFGQPIGRFQRVQDHIIQIYLHLDAARWTTYHAIWKLENDRPANSSVHLAKVVASEGYHEAADLAAEVYAGVGIAMGVGTVPHVRMSRAHYETLGNPLYHKRRMMAALQEEDWPGESVRAQLAKLNAGRETLRASR